MAALLLPSLRLARFGNGTRGRQKRFRPSRPDRQSSGNEEMTPFGRLRIERHLDHRTVFRGMTFEMFWSKSAFPNESWRWTFMDLSAVIPNQTRESVASLRMEIARALDYGFTSRAVRNFHFPCFGRPLGKHIGSRVVCVAQIPIATEKPPRMIATRRPRTSRR